MSQLLAWRAGALRGALATLLALQAASCGPSANQAQSYYDSGMKFLAIHDNEKAAVEFRNALKANDGLLPAWRGLALAEEAMRHWNALQQALQSIVRLDPKDGATRIELARFLLLSGAPDQALELLDNIADPSAAGADLPALKAIIRYRLNDHETAIREANSALAIAPDNPDALTVLAADQLMKGDPHGALQILSRASVAQPNAIGVQLSKIRILGQLKDYQGIETLLKNLIEIYPKDTAFRMQLANLYIFQHRNSDAVQVLRDIAAIDPANVEAGLNLVQYLYRTQGTAAARAELTARIDAGGNIVPYQMALAKIHYADSNVGACFELLKALAASPTVTDAIQAQILLAQLQFDQHQTAAAEALVSDILARDGHNVDAMKLRAAIELNQGKIDAAVGELRTALAEQPRSAELMLMLAVAYERGGSLDLADRQYADAWKASGFNPGVGMNYVGFLDRRSGEDRAYDVLSELAERWPNNVQVLSALAEEKLRRGDWVAAEDIAARIKRLNDGGPLADQISGLALSGEHKYDASIAALENAAAAAPVAALPTAILVGTMVRAGRTDSARAFLQSALKKDPSNATDYVLLGNVELSSGAADEAEKDFRSAFASQPDDAIGYRALSDLYARQKKFDAALDVIRSGLKHLPDSVVLHLTLAGTLELKGDYDSAVAEYEDLQRREPGSLLIVNNLASLLVDHRSDAASLDRARSLAAGLVGSPIGQFEDTLGWVYYRSGDIKAAQPLLEKATAKLPGLALVHYHLAMCYARLKETQSASDQFREALARAPEDNLRAEIIAGMGSLATQ